MLATKGLSVQIVGRQMGLNICCQPGKITAIIGPNGAGKSTLLRALSGVLQLEQGVVELEDKNIQLYAHMARARQIALLSQFTPLCFDFRVSDVVALGLYVYQNYSAVKRQLLVDAALQWVGLSEFSSRTYATLSQGEQQRAQLARVLVQLNLAKVDRPAFLLLDEPTAHLDISVQHDICQLVKGLLNPKFGVVMVVHDMNLAWQYADQIVLLKKGQVVQQGPVSSVLTASSLQALFSVEMEQVNLSDGQRRFCAVHRAGI